MSSWFRTYNSSDAKSDVMAGLTVGIMLIPQGMAYAMLAGMPPIHGLYASLLPLAVYAFLGTSRQLSAGTVAIDSLIVVFTLRAFAEPGSERYVEIAIMFAAMVGLVHIVLSIGRMGFLVNLLSRPVILGFISAAATIIGFSQLSNIMGLSFPRAERIIIVLIEAGKNIEDTHLLSLAIGLAGIVLLVALKKWKPRFPSALLAVSLSIFVTWYFELHELGVRVLGEIPTGLPAFIIPMFDFDLAGQLFVSAITLALIQFTNVVSLGKYYATKHNHTINPNRELFAIGMANFAGSFFQSYAVSGGFSRSAVNDQAGAKSPLANLFAAILIALTLLYLTPIFYYLPIPILASIIMVAAFGMINVKGLFNLYKMKRADGNLALMTFVVTLIFGLQKGIMIGIAASVIAIMYRISRPNVAVLGNLPGTRSYRDVAVFEEAKLLDGILIIRVDASFSYANADYLKEMIVQICDQPKNTDIHTVVIDASSVNDLDTTAVQAFFSVVDQLAERDIELHFTGVHGSVSGVLRRSGLADRLGDEQFHLSPHRAVQYIQRKHGRPWIDDEDAIEYASE
ncbi:MAG: SulP family inorganic anion transporter [Rhodothermales bacterium]